MEDNNSGAWNAAGQIGSAGIAAIGQSVGSKNQYKRSRKLMDLQMQNQEMLSDSAYDRQLNMWEATNFKPQVEEMKKAGLNPGLMYGMSGGGGTTVGSNSAGGASGGHSPQVGMDMGSIVSAAKAVAELSMMKASTKKTGEEARALELDNEVKVQYGQDANIYEASNRRDAARSEGQIMFEGKEQATNMFEKLSLGEKSGMMEEFIGKKIENEAKRTGIELTKEKTKEIWHTIRQKWTQAGFKGLDTIIKSVVK